MGNLGESARNQKTIGAEMSVITFKEHQEIVVTADTHIGIRSMELSIPNNFTCRVELDIYGDFADITFDYGNRKFVAYAVPVECFEIIQ